VIEGKWKPIVVNALKLRPLRFGQLRRHAPEATRKVLTGHLRELEKDQIISRKSFGQRWERVEYQLPAYGVPVLIDPDGENRAGNTKNSWRRTKLESSQAIPTWGQNAACPKPNEPSLHRLDESPIMPPAISIHGRETRSVYPGRYGRWPGSDGEPSTKKRGPTIGPALDLTTTRPRKACC
jgi:hypothetical protein